MEKWSLVGAQRAVIVGGCLAMVYTQVTTCPLLIEFARSLGADSFHVGILGAAPTGLFFMQFLAALATRRARYRRPWWLVASLLHRVSYLPIVAGPWLFPDCPAATWVWWLVGATLVNHGLQHFGTPLWLSWMGDYLPTRGLSQFWAVRHLWQQWTAAATLLICSLVLVHSGWGMWSSFGCLMILASGLGIIDILLFLKVEEPPAQFHASADWRSVLVAPFRDARFRSFIEYCCFWHFAAMVGAPFIGMYLLQEIGMGLDRVLLVWALSWIGGAVWSRKFGGLAEKCGHRPLLVLCTMLKAVNMAALLVVPRDPNLAFWVLVPVLMMDAQLNAGINIANQGYLLKYSPQENRTMFIAAGNALAGLVGGITAVLAGYGLSHFRGWQAEWLGQTVGPFQVVFFASLVLRVAAVALARRVREPEAHRTPAALRELVDSVAPRILRFPRSEPVSDVPGHSTVACATSVEPTVQEIRRAA
ncbi:MAG: hypothetical protein U0935_18680 [Pirellulales bacterium]